MDSNKLREEMASISNATCDVIDAVKNLIDTVDKAEEITPTAKSVIAASLKETVIKLMYGEGAHVTVPYPHRREYSSFYKKDGHERNDISNPFAFKLDEIQEDEDNV